MKPVFKCDYCKFTGAEDEVRKHELECANNYNKRSCLTCIHRDGIKSTENGWAYKCKEGNDIPAHHIYENCYKYEREEKVESNFNSYNPFSWFGLGF